MRNDVPADGFASVSASKQSTGSWIRLNLVGDEDGDVELLGHALKTSKMDSELGLTVLELSAANVVDTEESSDRIDDEETVLARGEVLVELIEELMLQLAVLGTSDGNVLHRSLSVDVEALSNLNDSLGAEGTFCIYTGGQRVAVDRAWRRWYRCMPHDRCHLLG